MDPNSIELPSQITVNIPAALSAVGGIMIVVFQLLRRLPIIEKYKQYLPYLAVILMVIIGQVLQLGDLMTLCVAGAAVAGAYDGAKVIPGIDSILKLLARKL